MKGDFLLLEKSVVSFSHFQNLQFDLWYNGTMANKTQQKGRTRRPTKAELEKQKVIKKWVLTGFTIFILFFASLRLGVLGILVYNLIRFFFGSLAYLMIFAVIAYLLLAKWLKKFEGMVVGFFVLLIGLLLEWHAYLFTFSHVKDKEVIGTTFNLLLGEITSGSTKLFTGGGMFGALFYKPIAFLLSNIGSFLLGGLFIILGLFIMSPWDIDDVMTFFSTHYSNFRDKRELRKQQRFVRQEELRRLRDEKAKREAERLEEEVLAQLTVDAEKGEILEDTTVITEPEIISYETRQEPEEDIYDLDVFEQPTKVSSHTISVDAVNDEQEDIVEVDFTPHRHLNYQLPGLDLFAPDKPKNQNKEKRIVRENIRILEETFASFGIKVVVERAEIGPSVTKYEIKPAVGVRVNRISNLADDLALALAAKDVRIEAPIPGKSLVGIEVPNSEIATVSFRELWEQAKTNPDNLLEIPLGKAVNGTTRSFDLARMPHLLVAGSTGSGKSVAVNGIISSILMKAKPDQVKFMMIDPKMVELSVYNDIPHLLIPVVTNPRKASKALQKVVDEMENRYELFSKVGVRNIAGYNAKVETFNRQSQEKEIPLPLLVVIVDELADLMMVASKEVEDSIIRLGQKARAAGIHMILATQRPSVDVISGLIKANVPSRIAFAVSSGTDSRTILDENGAEKLLGRGDMLFKPIDENHPVRLQGSFISDDDVERIVNFIKGQADAEYDETFEPGDIDDTDVNSSSGSSSSDGDPLFEEAKRLVIETQKASASMLQRRLSVGFNRATRLMEELEEAGVIGPAEGTKPRKVLQTQ